MSSTREEKIEILLKAKEALQSPTKHGWGVALQKVGYPAGKIPSSWNMAVGKFKLFDVEVGIHTNKYFLKDCN